MRNITALLHEIASKSADYRLEQIHERDAALERIDDDLLEALEAQMLQDGPTPQLQAVRRNVEAVKADLEAQQAAFFDHLRKKAGSAPDPAEEFRAQLQRYTAWPSVLTPDEGDRLHAFLTRYLLPWPIPEAASPREPQMVGLQPTPISIVLDLLHQAAFQPGDVFYDLGSGLGHVVILAHLLSGIPSRGIEIDPAYCAYAERLAGELRLPGVQFRHGDARDADYGDGTIFFFYTPFTDDLLRDVLGRIRHAAGTRPITIYSFGPGTLQIADTAWLRRCDPHGGQVDRLGVFRPVSSITNLEK